jgi:intein/homing endonuclease
MQYIPNNAKVKVDFSILPKLFPENKLTEFSKKIGINLKSASRYRNGTRAIPVNLFKRLVKLNKQKFVDFQGGLSFKLQKGGNYFKIGPYIEIDQDWIYVSQLINGDGHIHSKFWYIEFTNQDEGLINYVYLFFIKLGLGKNCFNIIKTPHAIYLTIRPGILAPIFSGCLAVSVGKKEEILIPKWVLKNRIFSISALRGAFDAEGCVSLTSTRRISITSNSLTWINQLSQILDNLKIKSIIYKEYKNRKKPIYRLFITHLKNIRRFSELVNPLHSERKLKLVEACKDFSKNYKGKYHKLILEAISKNYNRNSKIQMFTKLNTKVLDNNLTWLKRHKLIFAKERIITNNGCYYIYDLTPDGKYFINTKSSSFFD